MNFTESNAGSSPEPLPRALLDLLATCITTGRDDTKLLAAHLHLAPATIDSSFKRIHERLGTSTRWQAISFALSRGWIKLPEQPPTEQQAV